MVFKGLRRGFIGLAAALIAAPAWSFGIGLQPTTVEIEIRPGDRQRQVINIANVHTEKTISLTVGLADWSLDEKGQIILAPPGDTDVSAADWARFSPAFLTLEPGQGQQIIVDMTVPSRLPRSGDYRFAVIASTILPEERGEQSGVWKKYQIATLFYLTTNPATSQPEIASSTVHVDENGHTALELKIENTGNAHARLGGSIDVSIGGNTTSIPITNVVVLSESERQYVARLPEGTDENADIEVHLQNTFVPQFDSNRDLLPVHRPSNEFKRAALAEDNLVAVAD